MDSSTHALISALQAVLVQEALRDKRPYVVDVVFTNGGQIDWSATDVAAGFSPGRKNRLKKK